LFISLAQFLERFRSGWISADSEIAVNNNLEGSSSSFFALRETPPLVGWDAMNMVSKALPVNALRHS
jgi:hypothetical protein